MSNGAKHLLLIGIDDYNSAGKWDKLNNAKKDVEKLKEALVRYGYKNPIILTDKGATKENIKKALNNLVYRAQLEDDVIIFYAGHGELNNTTRKIDLIPIDYDKADDNLITGDEIATYIDSMAANNVLLVLDCCFSGSIHRTLNAVTEAAYDTILGAPSRWAISAGGEERVSDGSSGSPFSSAFASFLQNNQEAFVNLIEVYFYINHELKSKAYKQRPEVRHLSLKSHKDGMFHFYLDPTQAYTLIKEAEKLRWKNNVEEEYLHRTVTEYTSQDDFSFLFTGRTVKTMESVVKDNTFIGLIANAGAGKTFELLHVQNKLWNERRLISIDVSLDNYIGQAIDTYLPPYWKLLPQDRVILYFDGLDEVPANTFVNAVRQLKDFMANNPTVKVVISCRTNFYNLPYDSLQGTFEGVKLMVLDDISEPVMTEYVNRGIPGDNGNFVKELRRHKYDDIAGKAYFFKQLFNYYNTNKNLNISRAEFFDKIIEEGVTSNVRKYQNTVSNPLVPARMVEVLKKMAYLMARLGTRVLSEDKVYRVITDQHDRELLRYLPFIERDGVEMKWRFEHNNLQELLSAHVLANLPTKAILERIVVKDVNMVAQYWVNTLSFLITIAQPEKRKELIEWIMANDPEVMIGFERERVEESLRTEVCRRVFDNYTSQNIWLASNRYKDRDFARFGNTPGFIEHLVKALENPSHTATVYTNVFRIIRHLQLSAIDPFAERLKIALYSLLEKRIENYQLAYDALSLIADFFGGRDGALIENCVQLLGSRKESFIRAGLYRLIRQSNTVDDHLFLITDGLILDESDGVDNRTIRLNDEGNALLLAIDNIQRPESIKNLLSLLSQKHQWRFTSGVDLPGLMASISKAAERLFPVDSSLAISITDFIKAAHVPLDQKKYQCYAEFYKHTGTALDAVKSFLNNNKLNKHLVTSFLTLVFEDNEILSGLKDAYNNAVFTVEEVKSIHEYLKAGWDWHDKTKALSDFESVFGNSLELGLVIKQENQPAITLEDQLNARLGWLFDLEGLGKAIASIYELLGDGKNTVEHVLNICQTRREYGLIIRAILGHYYEKQYVPDLKDLQLWMEDSQEFPGILLAELHNVLQADQQESVRVSSEQLVVIEQWIHKVVIDEDTIKLEAYDHSIVSIIWYLIERLPLNLREHLLLAFSVHVEYSYMDASPKVLLSLESKLPKEVLYKRVEENVMNTDLPYARWLPNAIYALMNKITGAYAGIKSRLLTLDDYVNHTQEFLEYWLEQTGDTASIDDIIHKGQNEHVRLAAVSAKIKHEKDHGATIQFLESSLSNKDKSESEKLSMAIRLIGLGSVKGLAFVTDLIIRTQRESLGLTGDFKNLSHSDCIQYLLQLVVYARQHPVQNRHIEHLISEVGQGLFNIGIQSHANYLSLKVQIEQFLQQYEGTLPDISFLRVVILNVKEIKTKEFIEFTIEDFEEDFKRYTFITN